MEDMVMVAVPRELVTAVYRFIAEEEERRSKVAGGEHDGTAQRQNEPWGEEDLGDVLENGTDAMKKVVPYLADHPGDWVKGQVLAELVYGPGGRMQQLGGALGSFTRTAKKRYGRPDWPFEARHNDDERSWEYRMDASTAEKVQRAKAA